MLKYALLGFGGLGKLHFKNLLKLNEVHRDITLVAICGADKKTITENTKINIGTTVLENVDFSKYKFYDTVDELLENEELDFVISALPTVMHKEVSLKFLNYGIHIFSEKPMALSLSDCEEMVLSAEKSGKVLMIGQCLRFSGIYEKAKEYIDSLVYGRVLRAEFKRYSPLPTWTFNNWILDRKQSGGCPLDMHVHDVDLINHFFGMPKSVKSIATHNKAEFESIFTTYEYDSMLVTAAADWGLPQKFPFDARLLISFEKAALEIVNDTIVIYTDEEVIYPETDEEDYFYKELDEFITCVKENKESKISDCESVKNSIKIVTAEIESAEKNGEKIIV